MNANLPWLGEVAEQLRRSTVQVQLEGERGGGSGIIWKPDGLIVTNAHVARAGRATVELWDGRSLPAAVTSTDARRDLAALRVEASGLPAATAADSANLRAGEVVVAVGNPLGFVGALSTGVVHAVGPLGGLGNRTWVQADVRLAPGNSGGPLADARGRVIGVNTMIAGGLALAVPSNTVARFLAQGAAPSLGVVIRPVPLTERSFGLLVLEVNGGSAAERASLLPGDLLVSVEGRPFRAYDDLGDAIERRGGVIQIQFRRGDRTKLREVTVNCNYGVRAEAA